jgi:hypothetical protein
MISVARTKLGVGTPVTNSKVSGGALYISTNNLSGIGHLLQQVKELEDRISSVIADL